MRYESSMDSHEDVNEELSSVKESLCFDVILINQSVIDLDRPVAAVIAPVSVTIKDAEMNNERTTRLSPDTELLE